MIGEWHKTLREALKATGYTARNWSTSDDICFAIYGPGDDYLGLAHVVDDGKDVRVPQTGITKRDAARLQLFQSAWHVAAKAAA